MSSRGTPVEVNAAPIVFCVHCGSARVSVMGWGEGAAAAVFRGEGCGHRTLVDGFTIGQAPARPGSYFAAIAGMFVSIARRNMPRPKMSAALQKPVHETRWQQLLNMAATECQHAPAGKICADCAAMAVEVAVDVEVRGIAGIDGDRAAHGREG